ncbi:hypothetical protein NQ314_007614 [Rhamnusium bicolor]|uniref:Retrotransposon gag domain-containing protein n=1 Tax=Rhamnusium bicolor TaxID=1586634 RepID=A0AAV8YK40_9CUCU|nr:hypothetical protein NQ314_007614 [Rhamnusium bicolor]
MATEEEKKEQMDSIEDTGNIELGDLRLSWIYKLKKDQIDAELGKFRLDLTGTVEEKKRRLIRFIREGCTSPLPPAIFPSIPPPFPLQPPPVARATAALPYRLAPESPALDPWQVHKWNTHFNGKGDPAAFLERLDEICSYTNIRKEQLLPVLPELLQGPALLWYRNNKAHWDTWAKFTRDFRTFYFPKPDEPATNYLTDLQTLVRRHGDLNPEQELRWLYRNLLPDYRQYIRRNDFTDVSSLSAKIKEFELLRQEVRQVYDGKEPISRRNTARRFENRSPEQYSVPLRQAESHPVVERPVPMPRNTRLPATPREEPPNILRQQDTPTAPQTAPRTYRSPEPSENRKSTTAATYDRNICWRCGRTGHFRSEVSFPAQNGKLNGDRTDTRQVRSRNMTASVDTAAARPDNRPHVKVQMFGRTFSALVDTGAVRSYLGDRIQEVCDQLHIAADDSPNLSSDLVLGMDILSQYRFQINPSAGTVLLNDRPISEPLAAPSSPLGGISLTLSQPEEEQLARPQLSAGEHEDYLKLNLNIEDIVVKKLTRNPEEAVFSSFKIGAPKVFANKLFSEDTWFEGIRVTEFHKKRNGSRN